MSYYRIELTLDDNDTLMATSPDFPEVSTFGMDAPDALRHARDAIEEAIAARLADWEDVPAPTNDRDDHHWVSIPTSTALKIQLVREMRRQGITRAELARRL